MAFTWTRALVPLSFEARRDDRVGCLSLTFGERNYVENGSTYDKCVFHMNDNVYSQIGNITSSHVRLMQEEN